MWQKIWFLVLASLIALSQGELVIGQDDGSDEVSLSGLYTIEGKVYPPDMQSADDLQTSTVVSINGGEYKGFIREDGTFVISGVPSGSYVLQVSNPDYFYEPVRVEINPKGKFRARKVNYVQPNLVIHTPYPLRLKALTRIKYFQTREQWKITDFLFSPMVLMMLLPLVFILILPKMISDPETKKELENMQFPKMGNDMPEISEMLTSFFTGGAPKQPEKEKKAIPAKQHKKRSTHEKQS